MKLNVCIGSSCHLKGSYNVIQVFQKMIEENSYMIKLNSVQHFAQNNVKIQG